MSTRERCICVVKLVSKWRCVLIKPGKNTFSNMVSLKVVNGYTLTLLLAQLRWALEK